MNGNKTAINKILQYKNNNTTNNAKLKKLLDIIDILLNIYSYEEFQTYPRPTHPNVENRKDVYFTMVAILLSLRTTLENERKATKQFLIKYKTPQDVLNTTVNELAGVIQSAGMPIKKANIIIKATKYVIEELNCDFLQFKNMNIDKARKELQKIVCWN